MGRDLEFGMGGGICRVTSILRAPGNRQLTTDTDNWQLTKVMDIKKANKDEHKPPLFTRWSSWYISVLVFLVVLIVLFSLFTKHFS